MGDVIRDAIIRLKIELQKTRIESPEFSTVKRAYEEQAKSVKEVGKATEETQRVVKESAHHHKAFGEEAYHSYKHAAEGAIGFARGIALLTASGEEDTRKLLESFAKIEAATALAKGAMNLSKFAAGFGPLGIAVAAVSAVATTGALVWSRYAEAERKAAEEAKKHREEAKKLEEQLADNWRAQHDREAAARGRAQTSAEMRRQAGITPDTIDATNAREREALARENKEIGADWRRRVGGFKDTSEGFGQLLQFGSVGNWQNALNLERRKAENAQRQQELDRERFDRERERQEFRAGSQSAAFGAAAAGGLAFGLPGLGATAALGQTNQENAKIMQKLLDSQREMLNKAVDAYDAAAERITQLERKLAQSQAP